MMWAGHVVRMGQTKNAYKMLTEDLKGETTQRPGHRWKDNIRLNLGEIWCEGVD